MRSGQVTKQKTREGKKSKEEERGKNWDEERRDKMKWEGNRRQENKESNTQKFESKEKWKENRKKIQSQWKIRVKIQKWSWSLLVHSKIRCFYIFLYSNFLHSFDFTNHAKTVHTFSLFSPPCWWWSFFKKRLDRKRYATDWKMINQSYDTKPQISRKLHEKRKRIQFSRSNKLEYLKVCVSECVSSVNAFNQMNRISQALKSTSK